MLTDLDRILVAARYRGPVVQALRRVLGAEVVGCGYLWSAERGRFFFRHGPGIHLASAISENLAAIRERLASLAHAGPTRSADGLLLIPSWPFGGARLAVSARAAECSHWEVSSPMFDAQRAWA